MDLISREAVLDIIDRKNVRGKLWVAVVEIQREVEKLPSVKISYEAVNEVLDMAIEAQNMAIEALKAQKTGKWLHDGKDFPHGNDWIHCSVCGKRGINVPADLTNYCPNCGSRMEREEE